MKKAAYVGGLLGLVLLVGLVVHADSAAIVRTLEAGGLRLLWLVPYRSLFFLCYAMCWFTLLRPRDPGHRAGLGYLLWVTTVRDAVDRLLPVASVGGSVVGIRLVRWRGLRTAPVAASVIVEIVLTLIVTYLFTAVGLILLLDMSATGLNYRRLLLGFLISLPIPAATVLLLRYGSVSARVHKLLRPILGDGVDAQDAAQLDRELQASLRRGWRLSTAGLLQLAALVSGSFEVWFALRLFGRPVSAAVALILESMTQAVRHVAFIVPAGIGVQEAGLMLFGQALGINGELALAVSMTKRLREVLCGVPSLASWQWSEGRRLQRTLRQPT